jgi:uncharacterized protein (DUF885 family)
LDFYILSKIICFIQWDTEVENYKYLFLPEEIVKYFLSLFVAGLIAAVLSCTDLSVENKRFESLANVYLENMIERDPERATQLGDHRFDHLLSDRSLDAIKSNLKRDRDWLDSLGTIDTSELDIANRIDYRILLNGIKYSIFRNDTLREYEWNPRRYNPGEAIYQLTAHDFAPPADRLRNVKGRLQGIPKLLMDARANLKNPPQVYTETAILQNKGTIKLIRDDLNIYLEKVPELLEEIKPVQAEAVKALEAYNDWLTKELLPRSTGDFRLGPEKYRAKFNYVMDADISADEILERAESELEETYAELYETAVPLFKKYFSPDMYDATFSDEEKIIRMVLDRMADEHPTADNIIPLAEQRLRECENFVREKNLVSLPGNPVKVVIMPEFKRGVAVAYCESPGPLEKNGETFYAISPPSADWDKDRVETYFREYNNCMLADLTVHEAIPGHYLQAIYANRYRSPTMIRAIFGSGTFSEGWATYCEQLMVEQEFGGPELKMQMLKMRLRMLINVIIDQKIHTAGMTEDEAIDLMMTKGFQEEGEAVGKWRRACLSSVQLTTYYVGNIEINDIRKEYQKKAGRDFNLKTFHDKLLSFGSPAPKYIKELMDL